MIIVNLAKWCRWFSDFFLQILKTQCREQIFRRNAEVNSRNTTWKLRNKHRVGVDNRKNTDLWQVTDDLSLRVTCHGMSLVTWRMIFRWKLELVQIQWYIMLVHALLSSKTVSSPAFFAAIKVILYVCLCTADYFALDFPCPCVISFLIYKLLLTAILSEACILVQKRTAPPP